jgi:hypothetical protein
MRPIGGEFAVAPASVRRGTSAGEPHTPCPATGRGALVQILRQIAARGPLGSVALPAYLCSSVIEAVVRAPARPCFYRLGEGLHIDAAELARRSAPDVVVLVSYFGLVDVTVDVRSVRSAWPNAVVIRDDVHSPYDADELNGADYAFTSLRKSFAVVDGAPVSPALTLPLREPDASSFAHAKIAAALLKHAQSGETIDEQAFLALFASGEQLLGEASSDDLAMSWMSRGLLSALDLPAVAAKRRENFARLAESVAGLGLLPMCAPTARSVPLFLPVRVKDRDRVRRELAARQMYCPAHWPLTHGYEGATASARSLYDTALSLVVDQRYDASDMDRLAQALSDIGATAA